MFGIFSSALAQALRSLPSFREGRNNCSEFPKGEEEIAISRKKRSQSIGLAGCLVKNKRRGMERRWLRLSFVFKALSGALARKNWLVECRICQIRLAFLSC